MGFLNPLATADDGCSSGRTNCKKEYSSALGRILIVRTNGLTGSKADGEAHARVYFTILKVRGTSACYESELHIGLYFINILILRSA